MVRRAALMLLIALAACERAEPDRAEPERVDAIARDSAVTDEAPAGVATVDSLRAALDRLVRGESGDSLTWFSAQTAGVVRGVTFDSASGSAIVDFTDLRAVIPNASSSAGSEMLLRELNGAVFGVPGVDRVEYRMEGDCERLGEWLQYGECLRFDRADSAAAGAR